MRFHEIINEGRVEQVAVWGGHTIPVYHNPSKMAFERLAGQHRALRGLLTLDGNNIWLWNAAAAIHSNIMQELGLDRVDCIAYTDGRWGGPVTGPNGHGYAPVIERLTPYPKPSKEEIDELMRALLGDG